MTERLYYTDAYLTTFEAHVVERADDGRRVYLDRTAFYPTSGGQPYDTGTINDVPVTDVVDEGNSVAHVLAQPLSAPVGQLVRGEIDWRRRFDHMQQHTGQHLLSALFADDYGQHTVSVHFGSETSTLDLDGGSVSDDRVRGIEERANRFILENRPVHVSFEDAATVHGLRKTPEREGVLRVVTIEGIDRSACGGTHVRSAAEIGVVLLRQQEKIRQATRLTFVCGERAVRRARRDFELLGAAARPLSASPEEVPRLVQEQVGQLKELESRARRSDEALAAFRARERYDATTPDANGRRVVLERVATGSPNDWRAFALAYCALPKAVFAVATARPPAILIAAAPDAGFDAGQWLKPRLQAGGGRGGGSAALAQGSLPSEDALAQVLAHFVEDIHG